MIVADQGMCVSLLPVISELMNFNVVSGLAR